MSGQADSRPVAAAGRLGHLSRRQRLGAWLAAGGAGLLALIAYVVTLAPGLLMNDSAEFQTLAVTLGHTHPTGYPVYLVLGKLTTLLPLGEPAWRVNLLSALAGSVAVVELTLLGIVLTGRLWLAVAAALTLGFSPTFWSQAIIAEVYAPAAAVMLGVLLCLALWQQTRRSRWLTAAGTLGGLSVGVHLTVALMAPAALVFVLLGPGEWKRKLVIACSGALGGLAVTLAAFALVDARRPPSDYFEAVVNPSRSAWGLSAEDLDGFGERLRFSLSARQYGANLHRPSAAALERQAWEYVWNLTRELPPLWLAAAIVGVVVLVRPNWRYALLLVLTLAAHLVYAVHHEMGDIHVGYIPTYVLLAVFATAALGARASPRPVTPQAARAGAPSAVLRPTRRWLAHLEPVVVPFLVVATVLPMFGNRAWTAEGRRAVWVPAGEPPFEVGYSDRLRREVAAVVDDLEDDAVVFTEWELLYAYYYVAHVEQGRTGMRFIQAYPAIGQQQFAESALEFIRAEASRRPVYLSVPLPEVARRFRLAPVVRGGVRLYGILNRR